MRCAMTFELELDQLDPLPRSYKRDVDIQKIVETYIAHIKRRDARLAIIVRAGIAAALQMSERAPRHG